MTADQQLPQDSNFPRRVRTTILFTRRRWDYYFLPAVGLVVLASGALWAWTGVVMLLFTPMPLLFLWFCVRISTPSKGHQVPTVAGTPGARSLIVWLSFILLLATAVTAMDCVILGHGLKQPLQLYHIALYSPIFLLLLGGVWMIERRYRKV